MRAIALVFGVALIGVLSAQQAEASELIYGCWTRPACGKVCKLVCEERKLSAVGYGCECTTICIAGCSQPGCKHCYTTCCCDTATKGCPPKIEFCWRDWISCGCAAPRQVKVLTKYQAEHKVCWYHWEVVDGCNCGPGCGCESVYKPAPTDTQIGQALPLSGEERLELASWITADAAKKNATLSDEFNVPELTADTAAKQPADATPAADEKPSMLIRFSSLFKSGK